MRDTDTVAVLGTLDSKGLECAFLADRLRELGLSPVLVDVGVLGAPTVAADVSREDVARAAGVELQGLRDKGDRHSALDLMAEGAGLRLRRLHDEGRLGGVVAVGGSGGTTVAALAMRTLPLGFPRIILSTVAAMDLRPLVAFHDIVLWPSVTDLAGLNRLSRQALQSVAAAMGAMVHVTAVGAPDGDSPRPTVAITALGLTTQAANNASSLLEDAGCEVVVFHANGMGGDALETLVAQGEFDAVLDLTLAELSDSALGGVGASLSERPVLAGHGTRSAPRVLVPGGLDMVKFGSPETVPAHLSRRPMHRHNATVTLIRTDEAMARRLARVLVSRVSRATVPVEVMVPTRGLSEIDRDGQPFHDSAANKALVAALLDELPPSVPLRLVEAHINDASFAKQAVDRLLALLDSTHDDHS